MEFFTFIKRILLIFFVSVAMMSSLFFYFQSINNYVVKEDLIEDVVPIDSGIAIEDIDWPIFTSEETNAFGRLEWSGICRAINYCGISNGLYWAISDSIDISIEGLVQDNKLFLIDHLGNIKQVVDVQYAGKFIENFDWEDIAVNSLGDIYILDNISNDSKKHRIIKCKSPRNIGDSALVVEIFPFSFKKNVEALFVDSNNKMQIIPKKRVSSSPFSVLGYFLPQHVYELVPHKMLSDGRMELVPKPSAELIGLYGVCTAADYYNDLLVVHCYRETYVVDWPRPFMVDKRGDIFSKPYVVCKEWGEKNLLEEEKTFSIKRQTIKTSSVGDLSFEVTEGACFAHDGESVIVQNEQMQYRIRSLNQFEENHVSVQ